MDRLDAVLTRSRELGFLGPSAIEDHLAHAAGFVRAWRARHERPPTTLCDLGAGGGVPGLVLGTAWPTTRIALLEASARRCRFLRDAVAELDMADRVDVLEGRAELLARTVGADSAFEAVTARSFGAPAVTAECAARLLSPGGLLLVADPPRELDAESPPRWPTDGLSELGLRLVAEVKGPNVAVLERIGPVPDRYPRRDGIPSKRPLF